MNKFLAKTANVFMFGLAALPLVAVSLAHAEPVRIRVSDLDLSQPAQVAVLHARIERAADRYCGGMGRQGLAQRDACRTAFKAAAMDQLRNGHREEQARSAKAPNAAG